MRKAIRYVFLYLALAAVVSIVFLGAYELLEAEYDEVEFLFTVLLFTLFLFAVGWLFVRFIAWLVFAISSAWHKGKK